MLVMWTWGIRQGVGIRVLVLGNRAFIGLSCKERGRYLSAMDVLVLAVVGLWAQRINEAVELWAYKTMGTGGRILRRRWAPFFQGE